MNAPGQPQPRTANKLKSTRIAGKLVNDYWEMVWRAKEQGKNVCWYKGIGHQSVPPGGRHRWVHGEAYSAMLAARHQEGPGPAGGRGAGLHQGALLLRPHPSRLRRQRPAHRTTARQRHRQRRRRRRHSAKLPPPDMIINAYPYCSTGQQWDDMTSRLFGKKVPIFKV